MTTEQQPVAVLSRALDQAGEALAAVGEDDLGRTTPCEGWTVRELADHLAAAPGHFLQMARGEEVDWAAGTGVEPGDLPSYFRSGADELLRHWEAQPSEKAVGADWHTVEVGLHTWDLVTALGRPVELDEEVAERGLGFMQANLTAERRGSAFGPETDAPADATAYERLAAFAGRSPRG